MAQVPDAALRERERLRRFRPRPEIATDDGFFDVDDTCLPLPELTNFFSSLPPIRPGAGSGSRRRSLEGLLRAASFRVFLERQDASLPFLSLISMTLCFALFSFLFFYLLSYRQGRFLARKIALVPRAAGDLFLSSLGGDTNSLFPSEGLSPFFFFDQVPGSPRPDFYGCSPLDQLSPSAQVRDASP